MKKLLVYLAGLLFAASVFAGELHVGTYFPVSRLNVDFDEGDGDFDSSGFGIKADYTNIFDSGFTLKGGVALSYITSKDVIDGEKEGGIDYDAGIGLGYSFLNTENLTLSLTGNLGLHMQYFSASDTIDDVKIDATVLSTLFYLGPELNCTYRFTDSFGIYAGLGIYYALGSSSLDLSMKIGGIKISDSDSYKTTGWIYMPSVGVSWKF